MPLSLRKKILLGLYSHVEDELVSEHPLRQLFWECTLRCNMACRHCGSDCRISSSTADMPFEDFRKVLGQVASAYDPHKIQVVLTGGEPLMRQDLVSCGAKISAMGFPWGLVTNGRLMTEEKLQGLMAAGMHSATVSLDGFSPEHDWMRGVPGSFDAASRAAGMMAKESFLNFDVVTCVNRRNLGSLGEFSSYLLSIGVRRWRLFTVFPAGRAVRSADLQLDAQEFRRLMEFIARTRKKGQIDVQYACEGFLGNWEGRVRDGFYGCRAGVTVASVLADGSISACPSIRGGYAQGSIYKDDFTDVWERRFGPYRDRSWMKKDECAGCSYFKYCRGGGMHLRDDKGRLLFCHMQRFGL